MLTSTMSRLRLLWLLKSSPNPNVNNAVNIFQVVQDMQGLDSANEHVQIACFLHRPFSLESTQLRRMRRTHFLGSQVLHAPRQLVGAGHQVLEGHLLLGNAVDVIGVLHPGRPAGSEVFPEVAFRGILDDDVERPCGPTGQAR